MKVPAPLFFAYARKLSVLEAEQELRSIRSTGAGWMEKDDQREYFAQLEHEAKVTKRKRQKVAGTLAGLSAMGIKVRTEPGPEAAKGGGDG